MYRKTFKQALNINKKTPNETIKRMLKSWTIDTLADTSYVRATNKWKDYQLQRGIQSEQ